MQRDDFVYGKLGRSLTGRVSTLTLCLSCAVLWNGCGGDDDDGKSSSVGQTGGTGGSGGSDASGGTDASGGSSEASGGSGGSDASGGSGGDGTGGSGGSGGATATGGTAGAAGDGGEAFTDGQDIFRYDTFGDEQVWTDVLGMHEVIAEAVSPVTALSVGLKVDAAALPDGILDDVDLEDPATTVALLELNAVVGVQGTVEDGELVSVGITCALCHSDVDDSVMDGIGNRLDGYANRDLNAGAILALSPFYADEEAQEVLTSWGAGYFDPRFNMDGINAPVLIPPIYGLDGVPVETYTGDGPVSYWNSYVAVTQMGGQGQFFDPRIGVEVFQTPDRVTPQLPALYDYQMSLAVPQPAADSFDSEAAERGRTLFEGDAGCSGCHMGEQLTDAGQTLHTPEEVGMDPVTAERSATGNYRTTPLRAVWQHPPYFHDGSAETLEAVVEHYDDQMSLGLAADEQADLVEYLKSL
jgi:hypothetical protein